MNVANKRVGSSAGQCSLFESYDSNGWSVCFWRDRSDPAAHAKHYVKLVNKIGGYFEKTFSITLVIVNS